MAVKRYNGTSWVVEAGSQGITYSATAPTTPAQGDIWVSTADINTFDSLVQTGNRNKIINGTFDIWQRGTSGFSTFGAYTADRWIANHVSGTSITAAQSTDVPSEPGVRYSLSLTGTTDTQPYILQRIESATAASIAGKTVTLSFYAKSTSGTASIVVNGAYATAVDNFASTTADVSGLAVSPSGNISTSWQRYSVTFTVSSSATNGYHIALLRNTSSATSTTLIAGVQLELGSAATPLEIRPIQQELALCQRYYQVLGNVRGTLARTGGSIKGYNVFFPVAMRVPPTPTSVNPITFDYITTTNMSGYTTNSADTVEQSSGAITLTAEL